MIDCCAANEKSLVPDKKGDSPESRPTTVPTQSECHRAAFARDNFQSVTVPLPPWAENRPAHPSERFQSRGVKKRNKSLADTRSPRPEMQSPSPIPIQSE